MDNEIDAAQELIESAMSNVRVVVCQQCEGLGQLPQGLGVTCPRCQGTGQHVEVSDGN